MQILAVILLLFLSKVLCFNNRLFLHGRKLGWTNLKSANQEDFFSTTRSISHMLSHFPVKISIISSFFLFSSFNIPNFPSEPSLLLQPQPVFADSTGKFSTKLTARKRYLPVIIRERKKFLELKTQFDQDRSHSSEPLKAWIQQDYPKLKKSMLLYGVSLRQAEYPDEISRKAEELSNIFETQIEELLNIDDKSNQEQFTKQVTSADQAFINYLQFTKIDQELK